MKFKGAEETFDFSIRAALWLLLLFFLPIITFALAITPPFIYVKHFYELLNLSFLPHIIIFCFTLVISYFILAFSMIFITAFFIRVLKIKYSEGTFHKSLSDINFVKFALFYALYYPTYKIIDMLIFFPPIKTIYFLSLGCKIGKNVIISFESIITDPCLTEIGDNTIIGGQSLITAHLVENELTLKKVQIGNNCLIGGGSFIMPGVIIEDNVVLAARSLVLKNSVLKQGKTYAGSPAKEITN